MAKIPLIDMDNGADSDASIEAAFRDVGFIYLVGHGIAPSLVASVRSAVREYFALPLEQKARDRISRDNYRGYIPTGFFNANAGDSVADRYEGYKLHYEVQAADPISEQCDLYGPNKWPVRPQQLKQIVLAYWRECDRVSNKLLLSIANILGTPAEQFLRNFEQPLTNMTLLHYPPQPPAADAFGIHPHKDTDALTILAPDPVGGLFVRTRAGQSWIKAEPPDNALIVNIGDLLELWSGGYFVSTPHKVVNTSGAERYSFPYFVVPRFDTVVRPLCEPQPGFDRPSVHVGDVSREVWRTNWPDAVPKDSSIDLGTLLD
ncbi:MAG: isopenicillin N synthase family dioxygenase [Woeseiaceae bacterium]